MQLRDYVKFNSDFRDSVNLYLDLNKEDKIKSYIPTKSSVDILEQYLDAVLDNKQHSTLLIGPYGKGKSNTLAQRSAQLTTLSSIYTISETLLKNEDIDVNYLPDDEVVDSCYEVVAEFWDILLSEVKVYHDYMNKILDYNIAAEYRVNNLLFKPVTQMALAHVAYMAQNKGIDFRRVAGKINYIDWSMDNKLWQNILVIGSAKKKMITGKDSIKNAGMIISYLTMGNEMTDMEKNSVLEIIRNATDDEKAKLPDVIEVG